MSCNVPTVALLVTEDERGSGGAELWLKVKELDPEHEIFLPLDLDNSLGDAGVQSENELTIAWGPQPDTGGAVIDVAGFLTLAAASGIAGNAAYDFLKETVRSIIARYRQMREARHASFFLTEPEAVALARACLCAQYRIKNPERPVLSSVELYYPIPPGEQMHQPPVSYWRVTFRAGSDLASDVRVWVTNITDNSPTPRGMQVECETM